MNAPSPQLAAVLVDELARCGVTDACLAPGSRSAPLGMALFNDERIRLHVRHDERSAGFLALGMAKASRRPVPVVCTSGSAVANLHPAVVEADAANVPLLLFTADRPPELRGTGANQTIDQLKIFGSAVRWFCEVGAPDLALPVYWRSVADRAWGESRGALGGPPGPVHLNVALREPLVPAPQQGTDSELGSRAGGGPWTTTSLAPRSPSAAELAWLTERIQATERGCLVVGDTDADPWPLQALAAAAGWPLLAEPQSGARGGPQAISTYDHLLRHPLFAGAHDPDLVVVVGRRGLSRSLQGWLSADVPQVLIDGHGAWHDPQRTVQRVVTADPALTAAAVCEDLLDRGTTAWLRSWQRAEEAVRHALDAELDADDVASEPRTARDLAALLPPGAVLTVGSSMPIRDLDLFMRPREALRVVANRGTSGIDGFVSTALGVAAAHEGPAFALCGDLSLLHDQNGLLPSPTGRADLVLVVLNNDGGGIFNFLPQANFPAGYETLFGTPHGVDLGILATLHGAGHRRVEFAAELGDHVLAAGVAGGVQIVEIRTNRTANLALHRHLADVAMAALDTPYP